MNTPKTQSSVKVPRSPKVPSEAPSRYRSDDSVSSESDDSVIGTTTRRRAFETASASTGFSSIELRLYRKISSIRPSPYEPVLPYRPVFLMTDCASSLECFKCVREHIDTDCNFMLFQLPEDMSLRGSMRLDRESGDAEDIFQSLLAIFRNAKKFPGKPQYRSIEVEVGFEVPLEDREPPVGDGSTGLSS
jgi:hypothetical protein